MIQKIPIIQNFGVFKDFNWNRNNSLQSFKEKKYNLWMELFRKNNYLKSFFFIKR